MEERLGVDRKPVVRVDSNLEERDRTCVNGGMSFVYNTFYSDNLISTIYLITLSCFVSVSVYMFIISLINNCIKKRGRGRDRERERKREIETEGRRRERQRERQKERENPSPSSRLLLDIIRSTVS